jgi:hypothetical protein
MMDDAPVPAAEVRLLRASDTLRAAVRALCTDYLRADSALSDARFAHRMGGVAPASRRVLERFRALDDSGAVLERMLARALDSVYAARTIAMAITDSTGRFTLRGIPRGSYAIVASRTRESGRQWWWRTLEVNGGRIRDIAMARAGDGHITCFDPARGVRSP